MTSERAADLKILSMATDDTKKFAVEIGYMFPNDQRDAFERGLNAGWYQLIDVDFIAAGNKVAMRVFKLTPVGLAYLDNLTLEKRTSP